MIRQFALVVLAVLLPAAPAWSACEKLPAPVTQYLQANPQWRLVAMEDLDREDQALWRKYRKDACPGFAAVNLDGGKHSSYALALFNRQGTPSRQTALVLRPLGAGFSATELVPARNFPSAFVIWRAGPGVLRDVYTRKGTRVAHDAIVYEKMESTATAYYLSNGKFRSVLTAD